MLGPYTEKESMTDRRNSQMPLPAMLAAAGPMLAKAGSAMLPALQKFGPSFLGGALNNNMIDNLDSANNPYAKAAGIPTPGFGAYAGAALGGGLRNLLGQGLQGMLNKRSV